MIFNELFLDDLKKSFAGLNLNKIAKVFPNYMSNVNQLEALQGHVYTNKGLAVLALMHRSSLVYWPVEKSGIMSNERLEFLGDALLNQHTAMGAILAHPGLQEGDLSKMRAALVGTRNLADKARKMSLGALLFVGRGELSIPEDKRENAYADAFEAVTAALFLDAPRETFYSWLNRNFERDFREGAELLGRFDPKTRFQQWTQAIIGCPPSYRMIGTTGTPQETEFIVAAFIGNTELARGTGRSKREASLKVATQMQEMVDKGLLTSEMVIQFFGEGK